MDHCQSWPKEHPRGEKKKRKKEGFPLTGTLGRRKPIPEEELGTWDKSVGTGWGSMVTSRNFEDHKIRGPKSKGRSLGMAQALGGTKAPTASVERAAPGKLGQE